MSKTRFTPWVVLACIGTLAGCTSGEDGTAGNTELNIVLPNGCERDTSSPECFDIQVVEYTIACDDGDPAANGPFLDNNAGFDDRVVINGFLEVFDTPQDGRPGRAASNDPWTWGNTLGDIYVAQGFMDLPVTQDCKAQLRARTAPTSDNPDGEVICSDTVTFGVEADKVSTVNVLMRCGLSFQAPVAQLDLAGDFSFNVSNFCPDLMVLNCLDSNPTEPEGAASTTCQVRFRDGDNQCGNSCDPQVCTEAPEGLRCAPACEADSSCPTEPTTVVSCGGAAMDCDGLGGADDTSCTFTGNTTGTPILTGIDEGSFDVNCGLSASGATVTCTAVTTDGDTDCDKTKTVSFDCPGLNFCDQTTPNDNLTDCEAINGTPEETCLIWTCDRDDQACVSTPVPAGGGNNCDFSGTAAGECDGNDPPSCLPFGCQSPEDCDPDSNDCFVPPLDSCVAGVCCDDPTNGCQAGDLIPGNAGGTCDSGVGSRDGTCDTPATGACDPNDECDSGDVSGCPGPSPATICQEAVCDVSGAPWVCDIANANEGGDCDPTSGGVGTDGTCQGGTCVVKVFNDVCARFAPGPVSSLQTCDGQSAAQTCICEKAEFIAIDCELLGNSAPLPLQASAQQLGVAVAGDPINIVPQDAIILPSALICGFIGAGFQNALVSDSDILATYTNADITESELKSFLATTSSGGALISLHGDVFFSFGDACGDNCSGTPLTCNDGTTSCTLSTFTTDCSVENGGAVGTGPGIVAPFFANSPGIIPDANPLARAVQLTPTAVGSVDIGLPYSGVALELPDVGGAASGCVGGACRGICAVTGGVCAANSDCDTTNTDDTCGGVLCATLARGPATSPRVMYDATCSKLGFAACGGTDCLADTDCPFNSAAIGGFTPGQTCESNLCTDVNTGSCGFVAAGLCPDGATSCGSCTDASGNTGECTVSGPILGSRCAVDLDCTFGVNDVCGPPTACADDTGCAADETCEFSDERCNPVIEGISGGAVPACCSPFGNFTTSADICKAGALPPEDSASPPPCCDQTLPNDPTLPVGNQTKDEFCENPTNVANCCAAFGTEYPDATDAQLPQLWVN